MLPSCSHLSTSYPLVPMRLSYCSPYRFHLIHPIRISILRLHRHRPFSLVHTNHIHLLRAPTQLIKPISQPLIDQPSRELHPNDPLAQTKHLRIIRQHRPLDAETVMCRHRADAGDFVRRDRDAEACAADEDGAVCFSCCNLLASSAHLSSLNLSRLRFLLAPTLQCKMQDTKPTTKKT